MSKKKLYIIGGIVALFVIGLIVLITVLTSNSSNTTKNKAGNTSNSQTRQGYKATLDAIAKLQVETEALQEKGSKPNAQIDAAYYKQLKDVVIAIKYAQGMIRNLPIMNDGRGAALATNFKEASDTNLKTMDDIKTSYENISELLESCPLVETITEPVYNMAGKNGRCIGIMGQYSDKMPYSPMARYLMATRTYYKDVNTILLDVGSQNDAKARSDFASRLDKYKQDIKEMDAFKVPSNLVSYTDSLKAIEDFLSNPQ